jgi:hypothetical protein
LESATATPNISIMVSGHHEFNAVSKEKSRSPLLSTKLILHSKSRRLTYPSNFDLAATVSSCDAMVTKPNPRHLEVSVVNDLGNAQTSNTRIPPTDSGPKDTYYHGIQEKNWHFHTKNSTSPPQVPRCHSLGRSPPAAHCHKSKAS